MYAFDGGELESIHKSGTMENRQESEAVRIGVTWSKKINKLNANDDVYNYALAA